MARRNRDVELGKGQHIGALGRSREIRGEDTICRHIDALNVDIADGCIGRHKLLRRGAGR
jgi:hypothetical protein